MIIGVDLNNGKKEWGERFGMTHFVNPGEIGGDLVPYLVNLTKRGADQIGGADYSFDCTGNVKVMRAGARMHAPRLGRLGGHRRGAGRRRDRNPPLPARHRPSLERHRLRRRARADRRPKIVDWYMEGKIQIDPMITHRLTLEDINRGFDLMHAGELIRSVVVY